MQKQLRDGAVQPRHSLVSNRRSHKTVVSTLVTSSQVVSWRSLAATPELPVVPKDFNGEFEKQNDFFKSDWNVIGMLTPHTVLSRFNGYGKKYLDQLWEKVKAIAELNETPKKDQLKELGILARKYHKLVSRNSFLHYLLLNGKYLEAGIMLRFGANPNILVSDSNAEVMNIKKDVNGDNAFHCFARCSRDNVERLTFNQLGAISKLMRRRKANVNAKNGRGETPLKLAVNKSLDDISRRSMRQIALALFNTKASPVKGIEQVLKNLQPGDLTARFGGQGSASGSLTPQTHGVSGQSEDNSQGSASDSLTPQTHGVSGQTEDNSQESASKISMKRSGKLKKRSNISMRSLGTSMTARKPPKRLGKSKRSGIPVTARESVNTGFRNLSKVSGSASGSLPPQTHGVSGQTEDNSQGSSRGPPMNMLKNLFTNEGNALENSVENARRWLTSKIVQSTATAVNLLNNGYQGNVTRESVTRGTSEKFKKVLAIVDEKIRGDRRLSSQSHEITKTQ